jgi:hypothetical protein
MQVDQLEMYDGTSEEITALLNKGYFAGQRVRLIVEPEVEDLSAGIPAPPFTVRNKEHLIELLREGISSPSQPVTEETWDYIRQEVSRRHNENHAQ